MPSTRKPDPDPATPTEPGATGGADDTLSYEQAREELVDTVRRLEAGGITLEESLALWERGERLAETCQTFLDGVRERLDAALDDDPSVD